MKKCTTGMAQVTAQLAENQRLLAHQVQRINELLEVERAMPRRQDAKNLRHAWHPQTRKKLLGKQGGGQILDWAQDSMRGGV